MEQPTPLSIWKRPWRGPAGTISALALLVAAAFVILCVIAIFCFNDLSTFQLATLSLAASLVLVLGVAGLVLFSRWVWKPQNLRRFLFAFACLVTLVALAYAEEDWRGYRAWENYRHELEAKGESLDLKALVPAPVPEAKNFACAPLFRNALDFSQGPNGTVWHDTNALAHLQAISAFLEPAHNTNDTSLLRGNLETGTFANLNAGANFYRGNTNYPQAARDATPAETVLTALNKFTPEIQQLHSAAATRPDSRFSIHYDYEPPWGILLPHLAPLRALTTLLEVRATAELAVGESSNAFEDLKLSLRLSDSIHDEPILIDHLVRLASLGAGLQTLREGLARHSWTDTQLAELETYFGSLDLLSEYHHAMLGERAFALVGMDYFRREGFHVDPMEYLDSGSQNSVLGWCGRLIPGGWYYENMLTIARLHEEFTLAAADARQHRVFPEISRNGQQAFEQLGLGPYTGFARLLMPALGKVVAKSARMQTYLDCARVACALERYRLVNGSLPKQLDELTPKFIASIPPDVIDGKPLRYRPRPDGSYLLYSVGWNQTDDGGQIAWTTKGKKQMDISQGDWVWEMSNTPDSNRVAEH